MKYWQYESVLGILTLVEKEGALAGLYFGERALGQREETDLHRQTREQLEEYFSGRRREFSLPLLLEGPAFYKKVWDALLTIPWGETCSYGQLARKVGNPKACRAVGTANHHNPVSIIVPCHRVIGGNGRLTGYGGGLDKKEWLLRLEGSFHAV